MTERPTVAAQLLRLGKRAGATHIFANLGSDHPAFIEAFASLGDAGPRVIVCPHEMTALSAAHGYAMVTGEPQLVLVHIDVGTANLGGSVHDAARGRMPAVIIAGLSPVTLEGERTGSRTEFIHYIQDTPRQDDIVRPYVKWAYELRAAEAAPSAFLRALQIARTPPCGPVYVTGAREIWDEPALAPDPELEHRVATSLGGVPAAAAAGIAEALLAARRPLVITAYLGRNRSAVASLVALSEAAGVAVSEAIPTCVNFPGDHPHHAGYLLGEQVAEADLILLLDVDVPWLPMRTRPALDARIVQIDADPLKSQLGHWAFPVAESWQADTGVALEQINGALTRDERSQERRKVWIAPRNLPEAAGADRLTEAAIGEALRAVASEKTVFVIEDPSGTIPILQRLRPSRPGGSFGSGGTGLGWGVNAAIGAKLADPASEVIAVVGDGSFVFGVPTSAYWVAQTYGAPFLTVIANNGGWRSPRHSTELVHAGGSAALVDRFWATMTAGMDLAGVAAAAGGALGLRVERPGELGPALEEGLHAVRGGRCAVVDVKVEPFSAQRMS
jgi:acetolactate synthase-1/2/3 large subunit